MPPRDRLLPKAVTMRIGVAKERLPGETRVALTPESVRKLLALGVDRKAPPDAATPRPVSVVVERSAGAGAFMADGEYEAAGAALAADGGSVFADADVVVCVNPPAPELVRRMREGAALLGVLKASQNAELVQALVERRVTAFAFEAVPRITRAQKVDALSSMSTVSGYRAVLLGAEACGKMFPMLMTAAGTVTPARVLVIGAGVAGLQAIATAKRLGAVVEAYDVRAAAKEQVLSLGARFVELPLETGGAETAGGYAKEQSEETLRKQRELMAKHVSEADVVITTALVPGRPAPKLIDAQMVGAMRAGAVIVDLAAEAGGNCELTAPGRRVEHGRVVILGPTNLPAQSPVHASQMYSRNAAAFLMDLAPKGVMNVDMSDEVFRGSAITHGGEVVHGPTRAAMGLPAVAEGATA